MSTSEIENWIENDEGLYNWRNEWVRRNKGKGGTRGFVKEHRAELVACIRRVLG
jgi:hypothetical protein